MNNRRLARFAALAAVLAMALAACGGDDAATTTTAAMDDMENMDDMDMSDDAAMDMNMGDPDATRADEVDGAEVVTGSFELLDTRPPDDYEDVTGEAWLARHDDGTTVTIELQGLVPGVEYISHLHAEGCATNGGPHFQFEEGGSVMPPNEIHLAFTADENGDGFMTAENHRTVDDRAVAVVVHPTDLLDNKIACAEF